MNSKEIDTLHEEFKNLNSELKRLLIIAINEDQGVCSLNHGSGFSTSLLVDYKVREEFIEHYTRTGNFTSTGFPVNIADWMSAISKFCEFAFGKQLAPFNVSLHYVNYQNVAMVSCRDDVVMFSETGDTQSLAIINLCKAICDGPYGKIEDKQ